MLEVRCEALEAEGAVRLSSHVELTLAQLLTTPSRSQQTSYAAQRSCVGHVLTTTTLKSPREDGSDCASPTVDQIIYARTGGEWGQVDEASERQEGEQVGT